MKAGIFLSTRSLEISISHETHSVLQNALRHLQIALWSILTRKKSDFTSREGLFSGVPL